MKFITNGGLCSKNVPSNSKDAIVLALNTNYIDGIAIDIHLTQDNHVVLCQKATIDNISNSKGAIKDLNLDKLKHINFGNKVKRQDISTLQEILPLFKNSTKILVINLNEQDNTQKNKILANETINIIANFPNVNIYLKSFDLNTVIYLNNLKTKAKIGIALTQDEFNLEQYKLDFYSICSKNVSLYFVEQALSHNRLIMLENVNTIDDLKTIQNKVKELTEEIFIITDNIAPLAAYYLNK